MFKILFCSEVFVTLGTKTGYVHMPTLTNTPKTAPLLTTLLENPVRF